MTAGRSIPDDHQTAQDENAGNNQAVDALPRPSWSWSASIDHAQQEWQALIVDYDAKTVLLRQEGPHLVLPGRLIHHESFETSMEPIYFIPTVQETIGSSLPLSVLRHAWREERGVDIDNVQFKLEKSVVLMEVVGDKPAIEHGYSWVSLKEANVFHAFEDAARAISVEIDWVLKGTQPHNRLAWQRPGWFCKTISWMEDFLREHKDARLTETIAFLRSTALGVILQAKTTKGNFFLKWAQPLANDAAYTEALARVLPQYVSEPVFVDAERQVMMTADYGEILNPFSFPKQEKENLSRDYASLQQATIDKTDELIRAGFPDFRPSKLLEEIDKLADDLMFKAMGDSKESPVNVDSYRANIHKFKAELKKLIDSGIPSTVTHNDLPVSNIYKPAHSDRYMFFDWVDGFVGHPFMSSMDGIKRECYLQTWTAYGSMDQLKEWRSVGFAFKELSFLILRMREASAMEPPDVAWPLDTAGDHFKHFMTWFDSE